MDRKNDLLREPGECNRNMPLRLVVLVGMFGRRSVSRKLGREENERKENEHGHAHADGDKEDQVKKPATSVRKNLQRCDPITFGILMNVAYRVLDRCTNITEKMRTIAVGDGPHMRTRTATRRTR